MSQHLWPMRNASIAAALGVVLIAAVIGYRALQGAPAPERTAEPTATLAISSPTASPSATVATSATPAPSPTPAGQYVNASMGYAIQLKATWHRATCGSSISGGPRESSNGVDLFVPIADADLRFGDVGFGNSDSLQVSAIANRENLSLRAFKQQLGSSSSETIEDATFAGRPALKVTNDQNATFLFADSGYVWDVGHRLQNGNSSFADREAMMFSFRFLSDDETRAARAAATPSPAPRSAEQVADVLADGFAKRDVAILARVIRPCFYEGHYQAGTESAIAQNYLEKLRQRFAQGLVVEVRARPISGDPGTTARIRSTWQEPGQPTREADLTMTTAGGTTYWDGTITCVTTCP